MTKPHLALLPGWSYRAEVMQPLARALASQLAVDCYELPTSARAGDWLDALDALIPQQSWLIGWSLGGMLAAKLAAKRGKAQCPGLITLCSNPCFYAREDWPQAMPEATFRRFCQGFKENPQTALSRFDLMVSKGSENQRELARTLNELHLPAQHPALLAGLELLASLDCRAALGEFTGAQFHLIAEQDAFLPAAHAVKTADALDELLSAQNIATCVYSESGHALPFASSERIAEDIIRTMHSVQALRINPYHKPL